MAAERPPKADSRSPGAGPPTRMGAGAARFVGLPPPGWEDAYHRLLTMPTGRFFGVLALAYVGLNVGFGVIYLLDPGGVAGARPGNLADTFFFSVQTMASVGYGAMYPRDGFANAVMTVEAFVSLANLGVATGLLFARLSRPTAQIKFSKQAVVAHFDGAPTLMFRAANRRRNTILEAQVSVSVVLDVVSTEGHRMRRFHDLSVLRSTSPMFLLTWQVMHRIDESSPLFGATAQSLVDSQAEVVVVMRGMDETTATTIHARHSYLPHEIVWGRRLRDVVDYDEQGRRVIDFRHFDELA